jgi:hypothetical protein
VKSGCGSPVVVNDQDARMTSTLLPATFRIAEATSEIGGDAADRTAGRNGNTSHVVVHVASVTRITHPHDEIFTLVARPRIVRHNRQWSGESLPDASSLPRVAPFESPRKLLSRLSSHGCIGTQFVTPTAINVAALRPLRRAPALGATRSSQSQYEARLQRYERPRPMTRVTQPAQPPMQSGPEIHSPGRSLQVRVMSSSRDRRVAPVESSLPGGAAVL